MVGAKNKVRDYELKIHTQIGVRILTISNFLIKDVVEAIEIAIAMGVLSR